MIGQIAAACALVLVALAALAANVHYHERMMGLPVGARLRRRASIQATGCAWIAGIAFIGSMVVINL